MTHPELIGFPIVVEQEIAWGDMDAFQHVNNVVYFRYFENARIPWLDRIGWMKLREESGLGPIIASTSARYRRPISYPDRILVGVRAADVQVDRVTVDYRLVSVKWDALAADGQAVVVSYDYNAAKKCPIPETVRKAIEELQK
ncbi:MAG TPA: thioesterase family protein [Urbifossiella sp.]